MYGTGRDATRRPARLRGKTAWARGSDAFRRWADTFVSAGAAVRRGAPSIDAADDTVSVISSSPRVDDAKAPRHYFAAPATRLETTAVLLGLRICAAGRMSGLIARPRRRGFDDAGPRAPH